MDYSPWGRKELDTTEPLSLQSVVHWAPLSMGFFRQEYWSRLPFSPPRDLPDPGIEPMTPALQVGSLALSHQGSLPLLTYKMRIVKVLFSQPCNKVEIGQLHIECLEQCLAQGKCTNDN